MNLIEEIDQYKKVINSSVNENLYAADGDTSGYGEGWDIDSDKTNEAVPQETTYKDGWNDALNKMLDTVKNMTPRKVQLEDYLEDLVWRLLK